MASDGGIFSYGDAQFYGSTGNLQLNSPVVGMAAGAWRQRVLARGGRRWDLQLRQRQLLRVRRLLHLNKPVVGMAAGPGSTGYWLVASDGGIFSYGNTLFYGSTGGIQLNKPIVNDVSAPRVRRRPGHRDPRAEPRTPFRTPGSPGSGLPPVSCSDGRQRTAGGLYALL